MLSLRYPPRENWLFYLLVVAYAGLIGRMTFALWSGGEFNVFAAYSSAPDPARMLVDANYVYWAKTGFLFLSIALTALNFDFRFAVAIACCFWSLSLIALFGTTPTLAMAAAAAIALAGLQLWRRQCHEGGSVRRGAA